MTVIFLLFSNILPSIAGDTNKIFNTIKYIFNTLGSTGENSYANTIALAHEKKLLHVNCKKMYSIK